MDLDVNKPKFFQFNVTIDGIDYSTLNGKLEFFYENVAYGFPAKVYKDRVEVEIPPLQSIIKKHILESDEIIGKLDITGEGFHIEAWKNEMNIIRSLSIVSDGIVVEDSSLQYKKESSLLEEESSNEQNENLLTEDVAFLKKLNESMNDDISLLMETKSSVVKSKKKTIKKNKFNKRAFLEKAAIEESTAVKNDISLDETSKNDSPEQKSMRIKIRNIIQESYIKKLKNISKRKIIQSASESKLIVETDNVPELKTTAKFDVNTINEDNVTLDSVVNMLESVGMTTEKTQKRMIEHAKDKGAKSNIEIFDSIKGLLFPVNKTLNGNPPNSLQEDYNKQLEFFANRESK